MSIVIMMSLLAATPSNENTVKNVPAPATEGAVASGTGKTAKAKKEKPKKICRSNTMDTGSRIARKTCKTEEEWQQIEDGQEVNAKARTI
jgi:hypothetical protein